MWWAWPRRADLYLTRRSVYLLWRGAVASSHPIGTSGTPGILEQGIESALAKAKELRITSIAIWLGSGLVEFGVLDPIQGRIRSRDLTVLVRAQLTDRAVRAPMEICVSQPTSKGARHWAATDSATLASVRSLFATAGVRTLQVAPLITAVAKSAVGKSTGPVQFVLVEDTSVVTLVVEASEVIAIRVATLPDDSNASRRAIERLVVTLDSNAPVYWRAIAASEDVTRAVPSAWQQFPRQWLEPSLAVLEGVG